MAPGPVQGRGIEERWAGLTTRSPPVLSSGWPLCGGRPSLPSASWVSGGLTCSFLDPGVTQGLGQSQCRAGWWALPNLLSSHSLGCRQGPVLRAVPGEGHPVPPGWGRGACARTAAGAMLLLGHPGGQAPPGSVHMGAPLLPSAPARVLPLCPGALPLCPGAQAPPSVHPSAVHVDVSAPFRPQASHGRVQPGLLSVSVSVGSQVTSWPRADPGGRGSGHDCPGGGSAVPSTCSRARVGHGQGCWTLSGAEAGGRMGHGSLGRSL